MVDATYVDDERLPLWNHQLVGAWTSVHVCCQYIIIGLDPEIS